MPETPSEASSKAFLCGTEGACKGKGSGKGGKGEFCGKVRDSKQGFRGARHVSR